jgi:hypothetical protein
MKSSRIVLSSRVTRLLLGTLTALLLPSGLAQPAAAFTQPPPPPPPSGACRTTGTGTICEWSDVFVLTNGTRVVPSCATLRLEATIERRFTVFYDQDGALLRQLRHVAFTGTITNLTTGKSVPYEGHFDVVLDYRADTMTLSGEGARAVLPDGTVLFAAGREVEASPSEILFESTQADPARFFARVCHALS